MSTATRVLQVGIRQVLRDGMLLLFLPAPFLMGGVLRILLPLADEILMREMGFTLTPWYGLSDALVIMLAPIMTGMVSAFLILDERDEGIGAYYSITPVGGKTYLRARLLLPMVWAFTSSVLIQRFLGLTQLFLPVLLTVVGLGTLQAILSCMLLVGFAGNKVEGLALSKLTSIIMLGLPAAWFLPSPAKYSFAFLPSFWLGEILSTQTPLYLLYGLIGLVLSLGWILAFLRFFLRRARLHST